MKPALGPLRGTCSGAIARLSGEDSAGAIVTDGNNSFLLLVALNA